MQLVSLHPGYAMNEIGLICIGLGLGMIIMGLIYERDKRKKEHAYSKQQNEVFAQIYGGGLTFKQFRYANILRDQECFHEMDSWILPEWGNALAGETGE